MDGDRTAHGREALPYLYTVLLFRLSGYLRSSPILTPDLVLTIRTDSLLARVDQRRICLGLNVPVMLGVVGAGILRAVPGS